MVTDTFVASAGPESPANGPTRCSGPGALTTWLRAGSASETVPVGVPDRCSLKEATAAVPNGATNSVVGRPFPPGVRKARLTCEVRPPAAAARRTSPSSASEDVLNLSPTRADAVDSCTEVMKEYARSAPEVDEPSFR